MHIYILSTVISCILVKLSELNKTKYKAVIYYMGFFILFSVSAFRYGVGSDYFNYHDIYVSNYRYLEPGFVFFNDVLKFISMDSGIFFFSSSLVTLLLTFIAINENSKEKAFSVFLYVAMQYYFLFLNGIRQGMAFSIVLFAYRYIKDKNKLYYLMMILLAASIHKSAFIMLPIYWFVIGVYNKKQYFKIFITVLLTFPILLRIIIFVGNHFYPNYFESNYNRSGAIEITTLLVINSSIFLLCLLYEKQIYRYEEKYHVLLNFQFISLIFSLFVFILPSANRVGIYFSVYQIYLIPLIVKAERNGYLKACMIIILILGLSMICYIRVVLGGAYRVLPYRWIF